MALMTLDRTNFPAFSLRLFLSVDIVGSTAYKQSSPTQTPDKPGQAWLRLFTDFYSALEENLVKAWNDNKASFSIPLIDKLGEPPKVWKARGDEIIFQCSLLNVEQITYAVYCLIIAIDNHRAEIKKQGKPVDLKATAWLAGFPKNNAEIVLGMSLDRLKVSGLIVENDDYFFIHQCRLYLHMNEPRAGEMLDFIGPQMDIGFRLAALSSSRYFIMSIDLVFLIIRSIDGGTWPTFFSRRFTGHFRYLGAEELKGVLSGVPYPIIGLSAQPDKNIFKVEDEMLNYTPLDTTKLMSYIEQFFGHSRFETGNAWVNLPFIADCDKIPDEYKRELNLQRVQFWKTYDARHELEDTSLDTSETSENKTEVSAIEEIINLKLDPPSNAR
ncbi:MAG: hypothetical protein WCF85_03010 [Rhodospirillaceae bacterium]